MVTIKRSNPVFLFLVMLCVSILPCAGQPMSGHVTYIQQHIMEVTGTTNYHGDLWFQNQIASYSYSTLPQTRSQHDSVDARGTRYIIPSVASDSRPTGNIVYSDYATEALTVAERVKGETFIYKDTLPNIAWQLTSEKKTIGDFNCQKAVGKFRGRTYDVWFAPEIPLPYGPWKLGGLPGLILEATTRDGELSFLFERIDIPAEENVELVPPKKGIRFADFKTFREETDIFIEQSNKALQARLEKYAKERAPDENVKIGIPRTLRFRIEKTLN